MNSTLTYIKDTMEKTADGHIIAEYQCACGNTTFKTKSRVKNGYTKYCENPIHYPKSNLTHGMRNSSEYSVWQGIKYRMLNPKSKDYERYHHLGMSEVLANSFEAFYAEVGKRPSMEHSIDRIDNTRGYFEGNIRWATQEQQVTNKKVSYIVTINSKTFNSMEAAARFHKVSSMTIIRWCEGFTDKRRGPNAYTPPKKGCHRERRYQA